MVQWLRSLTSTAGFQVQSLLSELRPWKLHLGAMKKDWFLGAEGCKQGGSHAHFYILIHSHLSYPCGDQGRAPGPQERVFLLNRHTWCCFRSISISDLNE